MIAVDTNLLVYAHRTQVPEHKAARKAMRRQPGSPAGGVLHSPAFSSSGASSRIRRRRRRPSTPAEASAFVKTLVRDADANIWLPREGFDQRLIQLGSELRVCGPRIFDLAIGLTAIEAGAREIWTHDFGFLSIPGLQAVFPLARSGD